MLATPVFESERRAIVTQQIGIECLQQSECFQARGVIAARGRGTAIHQCQRRQQK